ncbi:hypothetical protein O181_038042 [Austropuccinia psidii MF-1]|uniref:Uncharacterized protein n=1 Tax=Austropuccinia psidii MF-1 TaxID=1389203 RepID=A0A9Q3HBI4_9BASI|nr:hypothetical protein [Austropuccinia psidii MF-1]
MDKHHLRRDEGHHKAPQSRRSPNQLNQSTLISKDIYPGFVGFHQRCLLTPTAPSAKLFAVVGDDGEARSPPSTDAYDSKLTILIDTRAFGLGGAPLTPGLGSTASMWTCSCSQDLPPSLHTIQLKERK